MPSMCRQTKYFVVSSLVDSADLILLPRQCSSSPTWCHTAARKWPPNKRWRVCAPTCAGWSPTRGSPSCSFCPAAAVSKMAGPLSMVGRRSQAQPPSLHFLLTMPPGELATFRRSTRCSRSSACPCVGPRRSTARSYDRRRQGAHGEPSDRRLRPRRGPAFRSRRPEAAVADWHRRKTEIYTEMVAAGRLPGRPGVARITAEALDAGWDLGVASTSSEASVRAVLEHVVGADRAARFALVLAGDVVAEASRLPTSTSSRWSGSARPVSRRS